MALFCQNMLEIAIELAAHDPSYDDLASKFAEHFLWIAAAMNRSAHDGMWDEEDGFYYDVLRLPDGSAARLKVRSLVGLLPLCATTVIEPWQRERVPRVAAALRRALRPHARAARHGIHPTGPGHWACRRRHRGARHAERLRRILARMLDEGEFLSPYGIRSLSRVHARAPVRLARRRPGVPGRLPAGRVGHRHVRRQLQLARPGLDAGERAAHPRAAPVLPLLRRRVPSRMPDRLRQMMNSFEVATEIANRLTRIFLRDETGRRPVFGGTEKFQTDPHWRDHLLFYEYFHGDNGAGLGASHQTGWTGLVAVLGQIGGAVDARTVPRVSEKAAPGKMPASVNRQRGTVSPRSKRPEIAGPAGRRMAGASCAGAGAMSIIRFAEDRP